jgi:hypothetical protein
MSINSEENYSVFNGSKLSVYPGPITENVQRKYINREMTDRVTPDFHKLMSEGKIVNNNMSQVIQNGIGIPIEFACGAKYAINDVSTTPYVAFAYTGRRSPTSFGMGSPGNPLGVPGVPYVPPHQTSTAIAGAYSAMARTPVNAWVALGEARETIDTIVTTLRLIQAAIHFKGRDFLVQTRKLQRRWTLRRVAQYTHEAADLWLHIRYGIRPLVYDLLGLLEALHKLDKKARQRFGYQLEPMTYQATPITATRQWGVCKFQTVGSTKVDVQVGAGVLVEPTFENYTVADLLGLGNIVEAGWDLVPFSFVMDWFFNVSAVLSAWSPHLFVHPLASWSKVVKITTKECRVVPGSVSWNSAASSKPFRSSYGAVSGGLMQLVRVDVERVADPKRPIVPTSQMKLGAAQVIDLLALSRVFKFIKDAN